MPIVKMPDGANVQFPDDMPREQIQSLILKKFPEVQSVNASSKADREDYSTTMDVVKSGAAGLRSGIESLIGTVGDVQQMSGDLGGWIAGKFGANPETVEMARKAGRYLSPFAPAPTTEQVRNVSDQVLGADRYQPQSVSGEYARTAGEFAGAGVLTPGGAVRRVAAVAVPAVASETAGQIARNVAPEYEDIARLGGALGGAVASGAGMKKDAINKAIKSAPSGGKLKTMRNRTYQKIRDAGVKYDSNEFQKLAGDANRMMQSGGIMQADAPKTYARIEQMLNAAGQGKSPDWDEINSLRVGLGKVMREVDGNGRATTDAAAAAKLFNLVDDFEKNAPAINSAGMSSGQLTMLRRKARDLALRTIKGEILENRIGKADTYISGIESGLKNQSASLLRSKAGKIFNKVERDLIMDVAGGSPLRNALTSMGRAGFDFSRLGNIATALPGAAGVGTWLYTGDPWTAGFVIALASGAKYGARKIAVKDAQRALGIARLGPMGQKQLESMLKTRQGRKRIAEAIIAKIEATRQPAEVTVTGTDATNPAAQ